MHVVIDWCKWCIAWTLYDWIILRLKIVVFTVVLVVVFTVILMLFLLCILDHILECDILWMYLFLPYCIRKWHNKTVQSKMKNSCYMCLHTIVRFLCLTHCGLAMPYGDINLSQLIPVVACCRPAPNYCLNECWLNISVFLWHTPEQPVPNLLYCMMSLKIKLLKSPPHLNEN